MKWIKGRDGLPSLFKKVQWRNADGGNIPLGEATPLEHYKKTGANIEWHEWLDSSHPEQGEQGELCRWVKASERLPEDGKIEGGIKSANGFYFCRCEDDVVACCQFKTAWGEFRHITVGCDCQPYKEEKANVIEWLCKLSSPPPEGQDERKGGLPKSCKDKKRGRNDVCKYPIGSCELCQNNF